MSLRALQLSAPRGAQHPIKCTLTLLAEEAGTAFCGGAGVCPVMLLLLLSGLGRLGVMAPGPASGVKDRRSNKCVRKPHACLCCPNTKEVPIIRQITRAT